MNRERKTKIMDEREAWETYVDRLGVEEGDTIWREWGPLAAPCIWWAQGRAEGRSQEDLDAALCTRALWVEEGWIDVLWTERAHPARQIALLVWSEVVRCGEVECDAWGHSGAALLCEAGWTKRLDPSRIVACSQGLARAFDARWVVDRLGDDVYTEVARRWENREVVLQGDVLEDFRTALRHLPRPPTTDEARVLHRSLERLLLLRNEEAYNAQHHAEVEESRLVLEDARWDVVQEKARTESLLQTQSTWKKAAALLTSLLTLCVAGVLWSVWTNIELREELRMKELAAKGTATRVSVSEEKRARAEQRVEVELGRRARVLSEVAGREFDALEVGVLAVSSSLQEGRPAPEGALVGLFEGLRATEGLVVFRKHREVVRSVEFSPDGEALLSAGYDRTARIWSPTSGDEEAVLRGHTDWINSARWSPDGTRVVTASFDQTLGIWERAGGKRLCTLIGPGDFLLDAAFSGDGAYVVGVGFDARVGVWSASDCTWLAWLEGHDDIIKRVEFAPDGRRFATVSDDGNAIIWDVKTRTRLATLRGHRGWVFGVRWSADSAKIATAGQDGTLHLWDASSYEELGVLHGHGGPVLDAYFSPNNQFLASVGKDGVVGLWDVESQAGLKMLRGHGGVLASVRWSADSTLIAVAGQQGAARIWDARRGRVVRSLDGHRGWVLAARFDPQGRRVVTVGEDGAARVWSVRSTRELCLWEGHSGAVSSLAVRRDGTRVASAGRDEAARVWSLGPDGSGCTKTSTSVLHHGASEVTSVHFSPNDSGIITTGSDGSAKMWDVGTGREVSAFVEEERSWMLAASLHPDGSSLITAGERGDVHVWSVDGKKKEALRGHSGAVRVARWSPDGTRIVTGGEDGVVRMWSRDAQGTWSTTALLRGHDGWIIDAQFAFLDDQLRLVTAGQDGSVRVWDFSSARPLQVWKEHTGSVLSLDISSRRNTILTTGSDGTARLWSLGRESSLLLEGHLGAVVAGRFAPDGLRVATTGADGTVRVWDSRSGLRLAVLRGHLNGGLALSWFPKGRRLVTSGQDGTVRLWDLGEVGEGGDGRAMLHKACARLRGRAQRAEVHSYCATLHETLGE